MVIQLVAVPVVADEVVVEITSVAAEVAAVADASLTEDVVVTVLHFSSVPSHLDIKSQTKWLWTIAQNSVATNGNSCLWIGEFGKEEFSLTPHTPTADVVVKSS